MTVLQTAGTGIDGGAVGGLLRELGVPFAGLIGAFAGFILGFALIFIAGRAIVLPVVNRVLNARNLDAHAKTPLRKVVWIVIAFVAIAAAFGFAGFPNFLQSLATIAAAATLAIGFAMQDVIKNFVAGVFIFTDRPFRIGDWIEWEDGTYAGIVEDISLRVTRVRTFDNELLTVPNSGLTDGVIKNPVDGKQLRLKFVFGIGYEDDIDRATEIILEEARATDEILESPEPSVRLTELADSYVGLQSRFWIRDPSRSDFVRIRGDYIKRVKGRFDEEGIEIPFPQRDLSGDVSLEGTPDAA